jgi:hypothetical protein
MKSTQATVRQRVHEVLQLRLLGAEFHDIVQHASENGWGVGERQLWNYLARADDLLERTLETDRGKLFRRHVAQRRALYARAMAVSDYSTARAVLKDEAELLGLYPARRHELTGKDGGAVQTQNLVSLTDEQRAAGVAALLARVGPGGAGPHPLGPGDGAGPAVGGAGPAAEPCRDGAGPLAGGPAALLP